MRRSRDPFWQLWGLSTDELNRHEALSQPPGRVDTVSCSEKDTSGNTRETETRRNKDLSSLLSSRDDMFGLQPSVMAVQYVGTNDYDLVSKYDSTRRPHMRTEINA